MKQYQIIKIHGNNFILYDGEVILDSKIRGVIKHKQENIKPVVGDYVEVENINQEIVITNILPRRNSIIRPNVSNIDTVVVVQSVVEPDFNFTLILKYLAYYESYINNVIIVLTKNDLLQNNLNQKYINILKEVGYQVFELPNSKQFDILQATLQHKTFCFAGNSGVGKSTLINQLIPNLFLKTQTISKALNRGKHTTTKSQIILNDNYKLIDTPGFSKIDINLLTKQQLANSYTVFKKHYGKCKFVDCLHVNEPQCVIKQKVEQNEIPIEFYQTYLTLLKEIN